MKNLLLSLILLSFTTIQAQYQQFPKLKTIAAKKSWIKLYKKSLKITEGSSTKNEPIPYFYLAQAYFEISKDSILNSRVEKAFKNSMKALEKGLIKDDRNMAELKFIPFMMDFKSEAIKRGNEQFKLGKHNKALPFYDAAYGVDLDTTAQIKIGLCQLRSNVEKGQKTMAKVLDRYRYSFENNKTATYDTTPFMVHTRHLMEIAALDSAYALGSIIAEIYPNNQAVVDHYHMIVRNYLFFFFHYNKYIEALKVGVNAANKFPNNSNFIELEATAMLKFTDYNIAFNKFDFIEQIWIKYTNRQRDPDVAKNLIQTNKSLVQHIAKYHHLHQNAVAKSLVYSLLKINQQIQEQLGRKEPYGFGQWGKDLCQNLINEKEYYLAYMMIRYIKMYVSDDPEINTLEKDSKAKLSDYKLTLNAEADSYLSQGDTKEAELINLLKGLHQVKSYEKAYRLFQLGDEICGASAAFDRMKRTIMVDDLEINFKGSRVVKAYIDGKIQNELQWNGNIAKCKSGDISDLARQKTINRINYYRRFAGIDIPMKMKSSLNANAQKVAFEVRDDTDCKAKSNLASTMPGIQINGAHTSQAILDMMNTSGDISMRTFLLDPNLEVIGIGSTDKNLVLALDKNSASSSATKAGTSQKSDQFIAWPPKGLVPAEMVYGKWSFSLPGADFSEAKIKMSVLGRELPSDYIKIDSIKSQGAGIPTIAWVPQGIILYAQIDLTYSVEIYNVKFQGDEKGFGYKYDVTIIPSK